MINLGTQYYRPPFPESRYWEEDMARMAASGLNTVQLWVVWSWVEPAPGEFRFEDYDRLIELAEKHGLGVVLSTIAAIHPYWIHNEVPGSRMVDNMGNAVVSSNRGEIHFGLTPGGCFDHPGVWAHMRTFLEQVVTRYRTAPHLRLGESRTLNDPPPVGDGERPGCDTQHDASGTMLRRAPHRPVDRPRRSSGRRERDPPQTEQIVEDGRNGVLSDHP